MKKRPIENHGRESATDYAVYSDLELLAEMPLPALRKKWQASYGDPVPKVSATVLRLAIAFEMQKSRFGDLSREANRRLDYLARGKAISLPLQPGMRLVREWKGRLHVVVVDADGSLIWQKSAWPVSYTHLRAHGVRLVGSEMCIRDSGLTEKAAAA